MGFVMGLYAITGAATGIGAAIKQQLRDAGHQVLVIDIAGDDTDIQADLSSADGRAAAIAAIEAAAPEGLDGWVPCAGVGPHVSDKTLIAKLNYFGAAELSTAMVDLLSKRKGSICLISSVSAAMTGQTPLVDAMLSGDEAKSIELCQATDAQTIYASTKRAITVWMRRSVTDLAKQGIRINAVAPGYIDTPLNAAAEQDPVYGPMIRDFLAATPAGCGGEAGDISEAVCFLLSPAAKFIYGSLLFVDGGHDAMSRPEQF